MRVNTALIGLSLLLGGTAFAQDVSLPTSSSLIKTQAKLNLNKASATGIAGKVKGIGVKRAEAIVNYRQSHGDFKTFEDLSKVRGISDKFVKARKEQLSKAFRL